MSLSSRLTVAVCLSFAISGCSGRRDYDGPQRFAISGTVTVDGNPISGTISFLPLSDGQRVSGGEFTDGKFDFPEGKGPNAGPYRVEVRWDKPTGRMIGGEDGEMFEQTREGLPPQYHRDSEMTAEVSADQSTFDFNLKLQ